MAPFFMGGVQLPQGYSHVEEAVYFLPFSSQKFVVLIFVLKIQKSRRNAKNAIKKDFYKLMNNANSRLEIWWKQSFCYRIVSVVNKRR